MKTTRKQRQQTRKRHGRIGMVWMLLALLAASALLGETRVSDASAKKTSDSWSNSDGWKGYSFHVGTGEAQDLQVKVSVGLDGNRVSPGEYSTATAEICNQGADFSGYFQLIIPNSVGTSVMFQRAVSVARGETKRVTLLFRALHIRDTLTAVICDENGGRWGQKNIPVNFSDAEGSAWVGTLSDDASGLGYLSDKEELELLPMNSWNIMSDVRSLETLSVLVINDFDTQKFSQQQVEAIGTWVKEGGTLVLGTGAQAEKTLKAFSGNLLEGTIGQVKKITTGFGGSKKDVKDITQLTVKNAKGILTEGKETLVSRLDCGKGSVLVAEFDLNLDNSSWDSHGAVLRDLICNNISEERREAIEGSDLYDDDIDYYTDALGQGLRINEISGLPNLKLYGVLLLVYVALVGPIFYLVLRRKKKRSLLWGLIPLTAVIFSVMIYFIGISTRIQQSYINYLSQISLTDSEEKELDTQFSITNANNRPYTVEVAENAKIGPLQEDADFVDSEGNNGTYKYGIEYTDQKTTLHMDSLSAFESVKLEDRQSVKMSGKMEFTDLSIDDSSNLSGIVTNGLSYDLEDCILVVGNCVVRLGEIGKGESVSLEDLDSGEAYLYLDLADASYDWEYQIDEIFGVDSYTAENPSASRKSALLQNYYESLNVSEGYFYGFLKQGQDTEFTKLFDYAKYGETAVVQELSNKDIKGREGIETIGELSDYVTAHDKGIDEDMIVDSSLKEATVTYDLSAFQKQYKQLLLRYRGMENAEFQPDNSVSDKAFFGDVSAVNHKTGKTEVLIKSGKEQEISDLKDYIDSKGRLVLQYRFMEKEDYYDYYDLCIPTLLVEGRDS